MSNVSHHNKHQHMPSYLLLDRFRTELRSTTPMDADLLLESANGHSVFYVPFEHVNTDARLVLVGITPGPTQMKLAREVAREQILAGASNATILLKAKQAAAFAGMRDRINQMLDHFRIPSLLGLGVATNLWDTQFRHFQPTSLIPNAAFKGSEYFNGPFESILAVSILREQFEGHFIPSIANISKEAVFVAMGPVVQAGLSWCAARGLIEKTQILGYFPHASGSSGSQFAYFMRDKTLEQLKPKDPVRHRAHDLDAAYHAISQGVRSRFQNA